MDIDPFWTPEGLAAANRLGVTPADVMAILYSPTAIQLVLPASIWFVDAVGSDVVTVVSDQQARNTTIYEITLVRLAGADEIQKWRSKQR